MTIPTTSLLPEKNEKSEKYDYCMGRAKHLTSEESAVIRALHAEGLSQNTISTRVGRSRGAIQRVLRTCENENRVEKRGRKRLISERVCRAIVRKGRSGQYTANMLRTQFRLPVGVRRVQQILASAEFCDFEKRKKAPRLTPAHKAARLNWAENYLGKPRSFWEHVVFSDEKRFCLDGPDGVAYFWSDKRVENQHFSTRPRGGGGIMVWAGVCARGKTPLVFIEGNMNGVAYMEMLDENLMPLIDNEYYEKNDYVLFQQDHASCHTAKVVQDYFTSAALDVLPWAPKSPDLNIIENIWGILVKRVYYGYRQFETVDDLKEALLHEWDKLSTADVLKLVHSMPKRCAKTVRARGGTTHY